MNPFHKVYLFFKWRKAKRKVIDRNLALLKDPCCTRKHKIRIAYHLQRQIFRCYEGQQWINKSNEFYLLILEEGII